MEIIKQKLQENGYILTTKCEEAIRNKVFLTSFKEDLYVTKIYKGETSKKYFINEKTAYQILSGYNITPILINVLEYKVNNIWYGILILEKLDISLHFFLKKESITKDSLSKELEITLGPKLKLMEELGIQHGDLHSKNILFKINFDGSREPYIIDFEITLIVDPITKIKLENTYDNLPKFEDVLKYLKT